MVKIMEEHEKPDCRELLSGTPDGLIGAICGKLDQSIFIFVSQLAGLFFIDAGDISINIVKQPEKSQVMISCRICNLMYGQGCSIETLLNENPEVVARAFLGSMLDNLKDFCFRHGMDELRYLQGSGND